VVAAGSYVYVADGESGLRVINVATPTAPFEVGFWQTSSYVQDLVLGDNYAYLAAGSEGLRIINIANPVNPIEVGFFDTPGSAEAIVRHGSLVYVADGYGGLRVINVVDPTRPAVVGSHDTLDYALGIAVSAFHSFVADSDGGLLVLQNSFLLPHRVYLPVVGTNLPFMQYEPNDFIQQASGPLLSDIQYRANIHSEQDGNDFYFFDMPIDHHVEVWLGQIPISNDYDLYLYDFTGSLKGYSGEPDNRDEHISASSVLPAGRYYVRVERVSGYAMSQPYTFRVKFSTAREWTDAFDQYATGTNLHAQGGWKGWDNRSDLAAYTSSTFRRSPPNSVRIELSSDLVHQINGYTSGVWHLTAWQYIPTTFSGETYFILLNQYTDRPADGRSWSTQVKFNGTLSQVINTGASGGMLPLIKGQWIELRLEIDLGSNIQAFYYNGQRLYRGTWTNEITRGGIINIAALDLYANYTSSVYYDDIRLQPAQSLTDDANDGPMVAWADTDLPWITSSVVSGPVPHHEFAPQPSTVQ
jgi:hypothetical protein